MGVFRAPTVGKFHVRWGRGSAQRLGRVLVYPLWGNMHLVNYVGDVLELRDPWRSFGKSSYSPFAGTSTLPTSAEKLQGDLLFLGDLIALRPMDVFPKIPLLVPVRSKNPEEVRGALCDARIGVFAQPKCFRMDEGG